MGRFFLLLIRIVSMFVSKSKYMQKVTSITSVQEELEGVDLGLWEYESIHGRQLDVEHRFFRLSNEDSSKPVLICLHGLILDGRTFFGLAELSKKWRILAYDFPDSTAAYHGNLDDFVDLVKDFAAAMNISEADVMGVSLGGVITVRLAARTNEQFRIRSCILASTQIAGATKSAQKQARRIYSLTSSLPDYKYYWLIEKILKRTLHGYSDKERMMLEPLFRVKQIDYYRQVSNSVVEYNGAPDAESINCPVLVLQGDKDDLFSRKEARSITSYLKSVQYHEIPHGGHTMVVVRSKEIAQHILDFRKGIEEQHSFE